MLCRIRVHDLLVSPHWSNLPTAIPAARVAGFNSTWPAFSSLLRSCVHGAVTSESHIDLPDPLFFRLHGYPGMLLLCPFPAVVGDEPFSLHPVSLVPMSAGLFSLSTFINRMRPFSIAS